MNLIIDSIMGSGKTTWAIIYMNRCPRRRFIFATPFLTEDARIKKGCPTLHFVEPDGTFSKMSDLKKLVAEGKNIATTHALLGQWIPSAKDTDNLRKWNYTLILDEVIEVIQPVQKLNKDDMSILYTDPIEIDAATSKVNWIAENCPQRYRDIEKLAKAGRLHISRNSQLLDIMPADIFKAMPNLIIMTFLFEASHLCSYMRMHGMLWQKAYICDGRLCLGEADLSEKKRELKTLLSLYDGKYNQCGEERHALSATFWDSSQNVAQKYQVVKNICSFFLTFCHASVTQCMWAVFKERSKSNSHMVKGFKKAFVPFNAKATNEYGDRTYLACAVNVYDNPMILAWFHDHGQSPDGKLFALSAMIQWIWRSAVRNGLEIRLYLPSKRMRKILLSWLNS